jgi:transposase
MPAALRLQVTDDERTDLEWHFEQTRDAETRLRYQMVLLAANGQTAPQIAPIVRRSVDTVQRVLHRYQDEGAAGVPHRPRPGRPPEVPAAWQEELCRVIEEDPGTRLRVTVGVASANWTTRLLAEYLAQQTGHRTGIETVRRHLHAAGYVCKRSTWTLARKAEEQPEWAKNA